MWQRPKDVNYYARLALLNKVKRIVDATMEYGQPKAFNPPIPFSYNGGRKSILSIERHQYMSCFKREFKTIRCQLDDGTYVRLVDMRMKHLLEIFQDLSK